jgi:hypothetical protein
VLNPSASAAHAPAGSIKGGEASPRFLLGVGIPPLFLSYSSPPHDFFGPKFFGALFFSRNSSVARFVEENLC